MEKPKKHKPEIIGLTGGLATGKSTVTAYLRRKGFPVICADDIAHDVVKPRRPVWRKIIQAFGGHILKPNRELNRKIMARVVFFVPKMRRKLEAIVHPEVKKEMMKQAGLLARKKAAIIFLDVPLLFESGLDKICDHTICVASPLKTQLARLKKHRGMGRDEALARIRSQMPLREKIKRADFVVKNTGTIASVKNQVNKLLQLIAQKS